MDAINIKLCYVLYVYINLLNMFNISKYLTIYIFVFISYLITKYY